MEKKDSNYWKNKRLDIITQIEDLNAGDDTDFDLVDDLMDEVKTIDKKIKIYEGLEDETKKRHEADPVSKAAMVNGDVREHNANKEANEISDNFMITRAMQQLKNKGQLSGFEAEMYDEATKQASESGTTISGNIPIPQQLISFPGKSARRRGRKQVTVGVEGPNIVDTQFGPKIPLLEIDPQVVNAGARLFTGLSGDVQFPRNATGATLTWEAETTPATQTTPTYDNIKLQPNRLTGYTDVSDQALVQSSFDLEADLRERLSRAYSIEWDRVALNGSGAGNEPLGIINYPGVGVVALGTPNEVNWDDALAFISSLGKENVVFDGSEAYMGPATVQAHLLSQRRDPGSGLFVMTDDMRIAGFPFFMDNNLQLDGGVGTDEQALLYGKWSELYLGQWGGTSILYDPFTQAINATVRLVLNVWFDVQLAHAEAFAINTEIIP